MGAGGCLARQVRDTGSRDQSNPRSTTEEVKMSDRCLHNYPQGLEVQPRHGGGCAPCDEHGLAVFALLRYRQQPAEIFLYAFDLLELDGQDLRREPIETPARATLASLLRSCESGLRLVEHLAHDGDVVYRHACKLGCEGIVSKRLGSPYVSGRTRHWLKFKNPAAPAVKREAEKDWGRSP